MVPIPEGSESYGEESDYTDYGETQDLLDQPVDLRGSGGTTITGYAARPDVELSDVREAKIAGACELSGSCA
jgi:hypothetical protein